MAWIVVAAVAHVGCPSEPPPGGPVGSPCQAEDGCADGLVCITDSAFPDGYCTRSCEDDECPDGAACRDLSGLMVCLQSCDGNDDCRESYRCNGDVCDLPCAIDADCAPDEVCDDEGTCLFIPDPCQSSSERPVGCLCDDDGQCTSDNCLPAALGGICTAPCTDEDDCPKGTACGIIVVGDGSGGTTLATTCLPENTGGAGLGASCTSDDACLDTICSVGHCTEICTACPGGFDCVEIVRNVQGTWAPLPFCIDPSVTDTVIELGPFLTGAMTGTGDIPVMIPPDPVSLTIVAETGPVVCAFPLRITDPTGLVWYDLDDGLPDELEPVPQPQILTVLIPDRNTSPPILGGTWTINMATLSCFDFTPMSAGIDRLAVYVKTDYGGTLDVNLHFTPASGVAADTASTNSWVSGFMSRFWGFYTAIGFVPGVVTYFDAPATYNTLANGGEVRAMCAAESEPGPAGPAVNVFVIGDFVGDLSSAAGISPGAPASFLHDHVPGSCVAAEALTFSADMMGVDVAHEVGHFLSMQHTSEFGGPSCGYPDPAQCFDNISDTAECQNPSSMSFSCGDFDNVMFPSLNGFMDVFTPGQSLVLSAVPVAR